MREMEKIASTLVPEKDWSLRIAAMQRVESLVYGGLSALYCFHLSRNYTLRFLSELLLGVPFLY